MCLHFCECDFPFVLPVLTVMVLTCSKLLHIMKQQQQKKLFPYATSNSAVCIWMFVVRFALFRSEKLIKKLPFGFIWWPVTSC